MNLNPGDFYAVLRGKYKGKCVVFIEKDKNFSYFLMVPGVLKILYLKDKDVEGAINGTSPKGKDDLDRMVYWDYIETLPENVYAVNKAQFDEMKSDKGNFICDIFAK